MHAIQAYQKKLNDDAIHYWYVHTSFHSISCDISGAMRRARDVGKADTTRRNHLKWQIVGRACMILRIVSLHLTLKSFCFKSPKSSANAYSVRISMVKANEATVMLIGSRESIYSSNLWHKTSVFALIRDSRPTTFRLLKKGLSASRLKRWRSWSTVKPVALSESGDFTKNSNLSRRLGADA